MNRLIPISEAVADVGQALAKLSPAQQLAAAYSLQTTLGRFPRDADEERRISKALAAEEDQSEPL